jgi:hypothetical protein
MSRVRSATVLIATLACLLPGCGDDGDADSTAAREASTATQAAALIKRATGPNAKARSGRIDGTLAFALRGNRDFAEEFSLSISGPFSLRTGSALPDYELEVGARNYGLTLVSAGGRSYAVLGTTGYELPASIRDRLVRKAAKGRNGLTKTLEQFGVTPWRWENDLAIAGKETIDGVQTTHITTGFYVGRQLMDANTLLGLLSSLGVTRAVGFPSRVTRQARRAVAAGADPKRRGASWIATKDNVYRQSGFTLKFVIPKGERAMLGGLSSGTVTGLLKVTEVGEPQKISAPTDLQPFADFELALDAVGDAQESSRGG